MADVNLMYITKVTLAVSELELILLGHCTVLGLNSINKTADFRRLNKSYC